ncbi:MAG TPA: hypothetical protein VL403_18880 [Candidatus Kryptonia bacterium]|nr:hypothetical protein [Candidatus Kryptonia bacterium]
MRNVLLLLLIVIALVLWNRSRQAPSPEVAPLAATGRAGDALPGGPVRQWQREPSEMAAREGTLLQPGSGVAPKAVVDSVNQGLRNSGER